jgi:ABC-2 type transport system ATP-binding protein
MSENTSAAIRIQGLKKVYTRFGRCPHVAVSDLTLDVRRGEVFGFIGPNGAGKTTTIKCLLGFLRPTQGRLELLGRPHSDVRVRHRIGYLPEVASYYHYLTPREMLRMCGRIFKMPRRDLERRVQEVLEVVGLARREDDRIGTFSKGLTQRVGIAQALINDPDLLILDEPSSGLDPLGQREIRDLIVDLRGRGKTVFFSSHELSSVEEVCDRVAILRDGEIKRSGDLDSLLPRSHGLEIAVSQLDEALFRQRCRWPSQIVGRRGTETKLFIEVASEVREVLAVLDEVHAEVRSIERRRPRLEEVFRSTVESREGN